MRKRWQEPLSLYVEESRLEAKGGLAATLSQYAVRDHYEDLLAILDNEALGATRIYFLRPASRIGNRTEPDTGRKVIERFANHPELGREATAILDGRGRND